MFCPQCGAKNPDGATFCGKCGTKMVKPQMVQPAPAALFAQGAMPQPASNMPVAPAKAKRRSTIGIAIVAVVVIAAALCIYFFACSTKPVYATIDVNTYSDGSLLVGQSNTRAEDGTLVSQTTTTRAYDTNTTQYKELGDGVSIPSELIGRYETNSNGDVTYIEYYDADLPSSKITVTFTYYSPGIIRTQTQYNELAGLTITYTYDVNGWMTEFENHFSDSSVLVHYEYVFASDGRSATMIQELDGDRSFGRIVLDENGYMTEAYEINDDGSETLIRAITRQKIDHPARYIAAISRLKN